MENVVISGISGAFPECDNLRELWKNLIDKTDMTTADVDRLWNRTQYPELPERAGKLKAWDKFDAAYFGIRDKLAEIMDPLGRLVLEKAYEAIVDAGINPKHLRGTNTGVFVGIGPSEAENVVLTGSKIEKDGLGLIGCSRSMLGNRISYWLGTHANGYCRSETVGVIFLQKAKHARRIYASIVHAKINCDGYKEQGITYPNGVIQQKLFRELYQECNVDPSTVSYIEAHGTGTKVGDPEEVRAIDAVFCTPARKEPLPIGSIKSNLGHSESGSGMCAISKVILMMENDVILPNINFSKPKKEIEAFEKGTVKVVTETTAWSAGLVGINNLGYGGSNAHLLLAPHEKEKINGGQPSDDLPRLICISGRTEEGINVIFKELQQNALDTEFIGMLHEIHSDEIIGHVFRGYILLKKNSTEATVKKNMEHFSGSKRPLWFVYGGMGSQWLTMGATLLNIPLFARSIEKIHQILLTKRIDLIEIITSDDPTILDDILHTIVAITAIQIALTDLLNELGIVPDGLVGHSVGEIGCAYADGCLTVEQAILASYYRGIASAEAELIRGSMAAIGLGYEALKDKVPSDIDIACHNGPDSCTLSGPTESVMEYVGSLKNQGVFAREVDVANIAYHSRYIVPAAPRLLRYLKQVVPDPKVRSGKWISSSVLESEWNTDKAKYSSAEYLVNNLLCPVYFEEAARNIHSNAIVVEIGPHSLLRSILKRSLSSDVINIPLTLKDVDNTDLLLTGLGNLYCFGVDMKLQKLYPPIEFPVSKGTRMIAPLIRWDHERSWSNATTAQNQTGNMISGERIVSVSLTDDDWKFLAGHVIDGRNLFPATGYLMLVWETISLMQKKLYRKVPVVFEDVRFIRATNIPKEDRLQFIVIVARGTGHFEIVEGGAAIVTGRVYIPEDANKEMNIEPVINFDDPDSLPLKGEDVYKELKLSGYNYNGLFKSITKADSEGTIGRTKWSDNFVSFIDNMLQMLILQADNRSLLFVPTRIKKLVVNTDRHYSVVSTTSSSCCEYSEIPEIPVRVYKKLKLIRSGGIEISKIKLQPITRRRPANDPVLEKYKFVPNEMNVARTYNLDEIIRVAVHVVSENLPSGGIVIKTVELLDNDILNDRLLISPIISKVALNSPLIQAESVILADPKHPSLKEELCSGVTVEHKNVLPTDHSASLIIITELLGKQEVISAALDTVKDEGFILSRENLENKLQQPQISGMTLCLDYTLIDERILLLRKESTSSTTEPIVVQITVDNYSWVAKVQKAIEQLKEKQKLVIYSENEPESGILGFFKSLKKEPYTDNVRCFFIADTTAPSFNLAHPLYKCQLAKDLAVNIYKNGTWGTYRHLLLLDDQATVCTHHAYVNQLVRGDLSSLKWIEGPINPHSSDNRDDIVYVHYASLNFKDVMLATGKISPDNRPAGKLLKQDSVLGIEYSGKTVDGKRYMGLANNAAMSSLVMKNDTLSWEVPDDWSLEDAATVPAVYTTVTHALINVANVSKGQSVLIHAGSGGVGQAAINVCLHYGCEIFTTVGSAEKREFIRKTFPQIPDNHIGNTRDTSFENMVMNRTNGKGVDIILNSLAEEKLQASVDCLAENGNFVEIGKFDLTENNPLGMEVFSKNTSVHGVFIDTNLAKAKKLKDSLNKMIQIGAVKPLTRTVYDRCDIEAAFRYMATGKHVGKIMIKLRNEQNAEEDKIDCLENQTYEAIPRYLCQPRKCYVICGGLGGIGLELADWLVLKGARNLVLTSRTGITTGYQLKRVKLWRSYDVKVLISSDDITKTEGVRNLLRAANYLGPVTAIFNLAAVLKDAIFENQTEELFADTAGPKVVATKLLDRLSRTMCPELEQFVVFSSISCSYGNPGQTNYAMANSAMERICESRKAENLPATAVEWGAIGDVGVIADKTLDNVDLIVGGTLQQSISSCLNVLDYLLKQPATIVSSMVVPDKERSEIGGESVNITDTLANALGLKNLKSISLNSTLAELGMDSMMVVEIRQTLEREFELFMTPKMIRNLTFAKLKAMTDKRQSNNGKQSPKTKFR